MPKRTLSAILCMLLVGVQLSILLPSLSNRAAAASLNIETIGQAKNLEVVWNLIEVCSGAGRLTRDKDGIDVRFSDRVNQERAAKGEIMHIEAGIYSGEFKTDISHLFGDSDNTRQCQKLTLDAGAALYGSYDNFLNEFYKADSDSGEWVRKDKYKDDEAITDALRGKAVDKGYYIVKNGGRYPVDAMGYRYQIFRTPLTQCFQKSDKFTKFTDPYGDTWAYVPGKEGDKKHIGPIMDRDTDQGGLFAGNNDGTWACSEFLKNILAHKDYFREVFLTPTERDKLRQDAANAQARDQKISDIYDILNGDTRPRDNCLAFFGTGNGAGLPDSAINTAIATWLVDSSPEYSSDVTVARPRGSEIIIVKQEKSVQFAQCLVDKNQYGETLSRKLAEQPPAVTPTDVSAGSVTPPPPSCESDGGVISWILCPVADLLDNATGWLDEQVSKFLRVSLNTDSQLLLKKAWVNLRNIAYIILIPMMLVTVIGTALGMGFIDAYTVKKSLPRMVIAILFIALSWEICMFLVNFANVLGNGIQGLIMSPFSGVTPDTSLGTLIREAGAGGAGTGSVLVGVAGGFAAWAGGFFSLGIIISTLGSVALVLGIAFLLLVARQVILLGLILAAPIAILAWIFPGNDKLWKFWWGAFSKLLFLFPVIQAMIAMGKVFAHLVGQ